MHAGSDGHDAPGRRNKDGNGNGPDGTSGPGEWLLQAVLELRCGSINQFEERAATIPKFRQIVWKQTYDSYIRKALDMAKSSIRGESFYKIVKEAHAREKIYMEYNGCATSLESFEMLQQILTHNNIDHLQFYEDVFGIMDKTMSKKNTCLFLGPPNAGKTLVAMSIALACVYFCNIQSFRKGQAFPFMEAMGTRCILMNEPRITDEHVETLKNIAEGCPTHIDVKYRTGQVLMRTPMIVATNHPLAMYVQTGRDVAQAAFNSRSVVYKFQTFDKLRHFKGHLNPGLWMYVARQLTMDGAVFLDAPSALEDFATL